MHLARDHAAISNCIKQALLVGNRQLNDLVVAVSHLLVVVDEVMEVRVHQLFVDFWNFNIVLDSQGVSHLAAGFEEAIGWSTSSFINFHQQLIRGGSHI